MATAARISSFVSSGSCRPRGRDHLLIARRREGKSANRPRETERKKERKKERQQSKSENSRVPSVFKVPCLPGRLLGRHTPPYSYRFHAALPSENVVFSDRWFLAALSITPAEEAAIGTLGSKVGVHVRLKCARSRRGHYEGKLQVSQVVLCLTCDQEFPKYRRRAVCSS